MLPWQAHRVSVDHRTWNASEGTKGATIMTTWAHGVSGHFNTAADWVGGVVPGGLDDAELTASGTYTVTSSQSNAVFGVALASGATLAVTNGTFTAADGTDGADNAGTISIGNNTVFIVGGASNSTIELKDSGIITLNSTGSPTTLVLNNSFGSEHRSGRRRQTEAFRKRQ
jgi:hypothetical protein